MLKQLSKVTARKRLLYRLEEGRSYEMKRFLQNIKEVISLEWPDCGGRLEHPAWVVSRCIKCDTDYARNKLSSFEILKLGLYLCYQSFAASECRCLLMEGIEE
jgi:hypothetical protein